MSIRGWLYESRPRRYISLMSQQTSILSAGGCSVQKALDALGPVSSLIVLREAIYGTRRFEQFVERTHLNEATVASRLRQLVELGILRKSRYADPGQRPRDEYLLTPRGTDLVPAIVALMQWGDHYRPDPAPMQVVDRSSGERLRLAYITEGGRLVAEDNVALVKTAGRV